MNLKFLPRNRVALLSGALVATALSNGCAYSNPGGPVAYREPPRVAVVEQDDYVYYPQYEVYYSNSRHQYGYREGNRWAWRPAPPGVSVNVLYKSPSVRMDFHDSPEHHHSTVVQRYPRNWKQSDNHRDDHHDDHHDDDHRH